MESERKIKLLQMFYAGALADAVLRLGREGVLEKITAEKKQEQLANGKARAAQLGIQNPQAVFEVLPEIFGCANWTTDATDDGFKATATNCMLCALSKRLGAQSPCGIYCLDAMEGMVRGMDERADYQVLSTLWDGDTCQVMVKTKC